jgi:hypothetical protein
MTGLIETKDTHNFLVVELHTNFAKKYIYIYLWVQHSPKEEMTRGKGQVR